MCQLTNRTGVLLGVQLDDEVLLDRKVNIVALGHADDLGNHIVGIVLQPLRRLTEGIGFDAGLDLLQTAAAVLQRDDHARLHKIAGDVDLAAVYGEVAVRHELTRFRAAHGKAQTVDHVIQTALQNGEQVLAGLAGTALRKIVVAAELLLEHAVVSLGLLLLTQLQAVLGVLAAALAVLAGVAAAALHGALAGVASVALQKELLALAAALPADGLSISCHYSYLL